VTNQKKRGGVTAAELLTRLRDDPEYSRRQELRARGQCLIRVDELTNGTRPATRPTVTRATRSIMHPVVLSVRCARYAVISKSRVKPLACSARRFGAAF